MTAPYFTIIEFRPERPQPGNHDISCAIQDRREVIWAMAQHPSALKKRCHELNDAYEIGLGVGQRLLSEYAA